MTRELDPYETLATLEAWFGEAIVRVDWKRGWVEIWCPFHDDRARAGKRGRPNFGVHLWEGHWKCFRCGAQGGSLASLARALKRDPAAVRRGTLPPSAPEKPPKPGMSLVAYAVSQARSAFKGSPAEEYVLGRGVDPAVAQIYGLGYGLWRPEVAPEVEQAALEHHLARRTKKGQVWWAWAGGVVYAEPLVTPPVFFIQVRHLRKNARLKYQSWGDLRVPGGAWMVNERTEVLLIVEGLFDMLVLATVLRRLGRLGRWVPLYTVGGGSRPQIAWIKERGRDVLLIPDPDPAGKEWAVRLKKTLRKRVQGIYIPPAGMDPDEAIRNGWWPFG